MIYFDHNSTTKLAPEVLAKMVEAYGMPLNSSSVHQLGQRANGLVEGARQEVKKFLNAENYEIIFTSSATEATNNVIFGAEVEKIFFSKIEHNSVYNCRPNGKRIVEINATKDGLVNISDLKTKIEEVAEGDPTLNFLTSAMLAQNETGAIQPISEITKLVHRKGGLIHCDIVQAAGKIEVDLENLNVDFASISAHKINGPQGIGALLIRKGLDIKPLIYGSGQEKSKRGGTLNVAGIVGFGEACKLAKSSLAKYQKISELRDFLEKEVKEIGGENVKIFSQNIERLPNTSYIATKKFATKNFDSQTQLINFDLNGICVSAGAACSSGTLRESRVLKAMLVDPAFSNSAIRVSLGAQNTQDEVEKFIKIWKEFYKKNT